MGIVHITNNISDLIKYKFHNQEKIIINTSAQPNSNPHLGTMTTLMSCFALARYLKQELKVETEVLFDELENSPSQTFEENGILYYKDQKHCFDDNGLSMEEKNMFGFQDILTKLSLLSTIPYKIRSYHEFQQNTYVRQAVIQIVQDKDFFTDLLFPSSHKLHLRTLCPICGIGRKNIDKLDMITQGDQFVINEICPYHGPYSSTITKDNTTYIDINTQFRDLTKGISIIEEDQKNNTLTIMLDGRDWSGVWDKRIHTEGMIKLGYTTFPIRLFSPMVLDWSGAKFSKSLYVKDDTYKNINRAFINYEQFIKTYGTNGFEKLWYEVESWIKEPKKFFRDYSIEYFQMIMEDLDERVR